MVNKILSLGIAAGILIPNIVLAEQVIIQEGNTSATAIGNNNQVRGRVNQSATQNQSDRNYLNGGKQTAIQQGQSNGLGVGNNNLVNSKIYQDSVQTQQGNFSNDRRAEQNATSQGEAIGDNNRITNSNRQSNRQNRWSY